jgi:hypothetical protein
MPKGNERSNVLARLPTPAEPLTFAVTLHAVDRCVVTHGWRITQLSWIHHGHSATWVSITGNYIGNGVTHLHTTEETNQDGLHIVHPRHGDGCSSVYHHNRSVVHCSNCFDQFILTTGQLNAVAIVTLGFPFIVGAHNHDGHIGILRTANCRRELVGVDRLPHTNA